MNFSTQDPRVTPAEETAKISCREEKPLQLPLVFPSDYSDTHSQRTNSGPWNGHHAIDQQDTRYSLILSVTPRRHRPNEIPVCGPRSPRVTKEPNPDTFEQMTPSGVRIKP